jgi:hypothetical protein
MYSDKISHKVQPQVLFSASGQSYDRIKTAFYRYSGTFHKKNDPTYNRHMQLKQIHTVKVVEEIKVLSLSLQLSKEQAVFAQLIAWLHDIGRFEQFDRYRTFADAESENHAEIALRVIKSLNILNELKPPEKEAICRSILNHNIPRVPKGETKIVDFYSRLLRDADKLDIWRINLEMDVFHTINAGSMPEIYDVPEMLTECIGQQKIITMEMVRSYYDSVLFRVSWVFDLNFRYTLEQVRHRKIVEKLLAKLPRSTSLDLINREMHAYLTGKLSEDTVYINQ